MKFYLNAMPKSGLHLLDALVKPLTMNDPAFWAGNYTDYSWTLNRNSVENVTNALCYTADNHRLLGHCGYDKDIEWYISQSAICHIFIYRDLRDVAVSQAHHIMSANDNWMHPDKALYWALGSFEAVLSAVWNGYGRYPGVRERWAEYEPWLSSPGILALRFADVVADLEAAADRILDHSQTIKPFMPRFDSKMSMHRIDVVTNATAMAESARAGSATFRKGIAGEWRKYAEVFDD